MRCNAGPSTPEANAEVVPPALPKLADGERSVLDAVADGADDADTIVTRTGLAPSRVMSALTALELKGRVRQLPGHRFVIRSPK